jgi:hypothetical protein
MSPDRNSECPGQPEICQLEFCRAVVYEQVLRLQVAVQDVAAVAVGEAAEQLEPGVNVMITNVIKFLRINRRLPLQPVQG